MRAGTAGTCRAVGTALAAIALAGPAAAAAKVPVYSSPSYAGKIVPKTFVPAAPPKPVVLPVRGGRPHVFVDAAGTAHIAWTDPAGAADDVVRTCRLPRGGTGCAAQAALTPRQPSGGGNGPETNQDFDGPFPVAVGNQLLLVDARCCNNVSVGGQSYGDPVYLYTSEDAGTTFTGPSDPNGTAGIIGTQDPSGDVVVYGGDVPSIGLLSDTQTDGMFFQGVPAGSFTSAKALLSTDQLSSGTLGLDGIRPIAAFGNEAGATTVREWTGNGSVNDPAQWTTLHLAADRPHIAGGPAGIVLLTQPSISDGPLFVRRVAPGGASVTAPVRLTGATAHAPTLSADPVSGRFAAAWIQGSDASVHVRTSADGQVWSPDQVVARVPGGDLGQLDVAVTADRGGFAVLRDAAGGTTVDDGRILAAQFGNAGATGHPGLGLVPGGSGPPAGDTKAFVACTQVHFGIVDALATAGCFLRDPKNPSGGAAVAQSTVRLNGLDLVPDAGTRILIDPRAHTIDTSGAIRVQMTGSTTGPITLWHGELHVKVPEASAGQTLFDFSTDDFAVGVKGFPVDGRIQVKLLPDAVEIPIHLALPAYFGGVHGDATLRANNADGLVLKSLEIGVDDAYVGPLELKDFDISYLEKGEQWHGAGTAVLPGPATPTLKGSVDFENGAFKHGFVSFSLYATVPIFTDVYLDTVSLGFGLHPTVFEGGVDLGAQPLGGRLYTIEMNGRIKVQIGDETHPTIVFVGGSGGILGVDVAEMSFTYNSDGYVLFHVLVHLGEPDDDWFHIAAGGDVYLVNGDFGAQLKVDGCAAYICASLKAAASKRGIAVCDKGENAGADLDWDDPLNPHIHLTSCHISRYTVAAPAPGGRAADGERTFVVPPGQEGYELELHGQGGPPNVTVVSPSGVVSAPDATPGSTAAVVGARDEKGTVAVVGLRRPAAGTWRIRPVAGSPAVTSLLVAHTVALPKVRARVSGSGARRRLRYTVRGLTADASVRFVEDAASGTVDLGRARSGTRTLTFRPSAGPGGRRAIRAVVSTGGFTRTQAVVARYTAPALRRPARVRALSARRHGTTVRVRVSRPAGALRTLVLLRVADGTATQQVTTRRSVTFRGVRRGLRATVTAAGVNVRGTRGPKRTVRVR